MAKSFEDDLKALESEYPGKKPAKAKPKKKKALAKKRAPKRKPAKKRAPKPKKRAPAKKKKKPALKKKKAKPKKKKPKPKKKKKPKLKKKIAKKAKPVPKKAPMPKPPKGKKVLAPAAKKASKKDFDAEAFGVFDPNDVKSAKLKTGKESFINRQSTGIPGFDELVEGGLPENSVIMLSGTCGTGKTTFSMQYLMEGAKKGEPGIYVSLEEEPERIIRDMRMYGWDLQPLIDKKLLLILRPDLHKWGSLMDIIEDHIRRMKAKRLAIDSLSLIELFFRDTYEVRKNLLALNRLLKSLECTTLFITEIEEQSNKISNMGIEEFIVDGVIVLHFIQKENVFTRAVSIRKMRSTNHSTKIHPIELGKAGIKVYASEEVF